MTHLIKDALIFLRSKLLWWLIPIIVLTVFFTLLIVFISDSGVAPFVYNLF